MLFPKEMRPYDCAIKWWLPPPDSPIPHVQPGLQLLKLLAFHLKLTMGEEISMISKCCNFSEN